MKAPFSSYLAEKKPFLKEVVEALSKYYDYVSLLATDSPGLSLRVTTRTKAVSNSTMMTERGVVVRVHQGQRYSEVAFSSIEEGKTPLEVAKEIRDEVKRQTELLEKTGSAIYDTPALPDEPYELFVEKEVERLPEEAELKDWVEKLSDLADGAKAQIPETIDCQINAQSTHVNKLFLTKNRDMAQSYVYSEASCIMLGAKNGETRFVYDGISGMKGLELFDGIETTLQGVCETMKKVLDAGRIEPGEYDIIASPEVSGLIAHEAFGHGVEMDMFVKNRALGKDYIGKRVGSELVTMHEGALSAKNSVASYLFDDEGNLAGDVIEIDHGILKTGVCDALSALRLGTKPTGNGKRENFAHKVYTRMTNTIFEAGNNTLEEMIASIDYGYLLEGMESGMEDPKHWGIQCIVARGLEIKDGKLTGKMVAPVVMTGYVPDLLGSISMASKEVEVFGTGGCGKGYKEWVKVADGGPYLKARARLG